MLEINQLSENHRDKLFKSGLNGYGPFKLLKGCLPQNVLSPLLNTLCHIFYTKYVFKNVNALMHNIPKWSNTL